jgi:hypothetical protein
MTGRIDDVLGDLHPNTKLTQDQIKEMVTCYESGKDLKEVAKEFGVHHRTVSKWLRLLGVTIRKPDHTKNITGCRFGRLTAIESTGKRGNGGMKWKCVCDCGNTVYVRVGLLTSGNTKSCGCLAKDVRDYHREQHNKNRRLSSGESTCRSVYNEYRISARRRKIHWALSLDEFRDLVTQPCRYCGIEPLSVRVQKGYYGEFVFNGVDRADNNIGYIVQNCVPCCTTCNVAKATMIQVDFLSWVSRVYNHSVRGS